MMNMSYVKGMLKVRKSDVQPVILSLVIVHKWQFYDSGKLFQLRRPETMDGRIGFLMTKVIFCTIKSSKFITSLYTPS